MAIKQEAAGKLSPRDLMMTRFWSTLSLVFMLFFYGCTHFENHYQGIAGIRKVTVLVGESRSDVREAAEKLLAVSLSEATGWQVVDSNVIGDNSDVTVASVRAEAVAAGSDAVLVVLPYDAEAPGVGLQSPAEDFVGLIIGSAFSDDVARGFKRKTGLCVFLVSLRSEDDMIVVNRMPFFKCSALGESVADSVTFVVESMMDLL